MSGTEVVAIVGILGTLAGTLAGAGLGVWGTWKFQQRQFDQEERTRFHERRQEIYATFNHAIHGMIADVRTLGKVGSENREVATRSFGVLTLIGSRDVVVLAIEVHGILLEVDEGTLDIQVAYEQWRRATGKMQNAMRAEIGVDRLDV